MKQTTLRGIDAPLARRLKEEARRHGLSLNRTILRLLRQATGLAKSDEPVPGTRRFDDLDHLIGTWSPQDAQEFERALHRLRQIDEELWR
jgi:hypothetical protein